MRLMLQATLLICLYFASASGSPVHWNYKNQGPKWWKHHFNICNKNHQSPINIEPKKTVYNAALQPFKLASFENSREDIGIQNNGHTLQIDLHGAWTLPIGEGALDQDNYKALQFHFHWAKKGQAGGSEHTVDGKHAWGELHVVHYNTKYGSPAVAMHKKHGLAVLAFFIQADAKSGNRGFSRITDWIRKGRYMHESGHLSFFNFADVLRGANLNDYYRYKGSLTTPTCDETVRWTVFKQPLRISAKQAAFFQDNLFANAKATHRKDHESGNFRPTQPLNGRTVSRSFYGTAWAGW